LVVNKEQRIPDIAYFSSKPDPASTANNLLMFGQEFHTSYWGHLGLLNLTHNFLVPDYVAYPNTAAASLFPANATVADMAHEQQALVGYVHPYESIPDPATDASLTHELPVDVALGKVDYIEVLGFSDHKSTAAVWYRLLNCGFRLPAAAGTDAMANFASLHGPVVRDLKLSGDRQSADVEDKISISRSGWCLLRAWSDKAEHPVLDAYPYATTSPIYVTVAGSAPKPAEDAAYFIAWIDRLIDGAKSNKDWNTTAEKDAVLSLLDYARKI